MIIQYFKTIVVAVFSIVIIGCNNHSSIDPWEAVEIAYKAKKRADLLEALRQLPATIYALKLTSECTTDQKKCVEAMQFLEFAFIATEGEGSMGVGIACGMKKIFALDYLEDVKTNMQITLLDNLKASDADAIRSRLVEIDNLQDSYINQCQIK